MNWQKAFGTVNHNIGLSKLRVSGAELGIVTWFDYRSEHKHVVQVNGILSSPNNVTCGLQ